MNLFDVSRPGSTRMSSHFFLFSSNYLKFLKIPQVMHEYVHTVKKKNTPNVETPSSSPEFLTVNSLSFCLYKLI